MATFSHDMADDMDVFYNTDEFAVNAVYTPKSTGVPVHITVNVDYGDVENHRGMQNDGLEHILTCEQDARAGFGGQFSRSVATVWVKVSDISAPAVYDGIEIDGIPWTVKEVYDHA